MRHGALLLLLLLTAAAGKAQPPAAEYGWKNVWRPQEYELWRGIHEKCGTGGGLGSWRSSAAKVGLRQKPAAAALVNCVAAATARAGASPEAVQFMRQTGGEVYMGTFREMGRVDLALSVAPMWNDPNVEDWILVNGTPRVVSLWEKAGKIDISRDPLYERIRARFPEVTMWPMHGFAGMDRTSDGGQRFVFSFLLLNGCRACDIAGDAEVAFDFDRAGRFLGSRLLRLIEGAGEERADRHVTVNNFRDFVAAIAPNTFITLEPGDYVLDKSAVAESPYVVWTGEESGRAQRGLTIRNVERLFISGPSQNGTARFIQPDESLAVLIFDHVTQVSVNNIVAGHSPASTLRGAGVLTFYDSKNVTITNSELYGPGLYGLTLDNVRDFHFGDSTIRDCSHKIMEVSGSDNLNFSNSRFLNNGSSELIAVSDSSNVFFDRIQVTNNRSIENGRSLFHVTGSRNFTLTNSTIRGNVARALESVKGSVSYDRSNKIDAAQFAAVPAPAVPVAAPAGETEKWRGFIREHFALIIRMPKPKSDWREILVLGTWGKFDTYQELYLLAVNRRNLAADALSSADGFLKKGDLPNTRKYAGRAAKFYAQSNELFNVAELVFAGSVEMTADTLNAIYRGTTEALRFGLAVECGPKCVEVADVVLLMTDYAVDSSTVGADEAKRNALAKALTTALLKSSGLPTWVEKRTTHSIGGSGLYNLLDKTLSAPELQKEVMRLLAESGAYAADQFLNEVVRKAIQSQLEFLRHAHNLSPESSAGPEQGRLQPVLQRGQPLCLTCE